jgi:hypothetical protein
LDWAAFQQSSSQWVAAYNAFRSNPTPGNALSAGLQFLYASVDAAGAALPAVPAVAGYVQKATQVTVDAAEAGVAVYKSVTKTGEVNYVGITNDLPRRAIEQFRAKGIQIEKVVGGLSRDAARAVEQALIELHGLGKEGGTLLNKINSISKKNPEYGKLVKQGLEILERIGY